MKKLVLLVSLILVGLSTQAQEIKWMSMNEALVAQKKNPKPIFMDAYTVWCGPCKMLDRNTFSHPKLAAYVNKHFYPVKFNAEGNESITYEGNEFGNPGFKPERATQRNSPHDFSRYLRVTAYPTLVFFDELGKTIFPASGYRDVKQLEILLKIVADKEYKRLKTDEEYKAYMDSFTYEFEN